MPRILAIPYTKHLVTDKLEFYKKQLLGENMPFPIDLSLGEHKFTEHAVSRTAEYAELSHPPLIELTASMQGGPSPPFLLSQGTTGTVVAIQMDAQVAMKLAAHIFHLARKMGWLPQTAGEPPI